MDRRSNDSRNLAVLGLVALVVIAGTIIYSVGQLNPRGRTPTPAPTATAAARATSTPVPTPTPVIVTSGMVIRQMQAVQRLETTRYSIETVVEATAGTTGVFQSGEKLLLIAHGTVVVGFDLAKLTAGDVTVSPDGKSVTVNLPAPEIFTSALDEERTRVYSRESGRTVGFPRTADPNLESAARRQGLAQIVQTACEDGIARRATQDGGEAMRDLLTIAGFTSVQVRVKESTAPLCPGGSATPRP
jgi:hypothetical protein